ncbi:hypothetical protein O3Q52_27160 [Streptomyces sp. ActVer]|uniref:hypothetical protein n=1 Tax=Streptomyces sp. ActVer TaxID=3014558 RepID=UPI0022B3CDA7|nr:hypothetical protein [Streptomyces sp. ActVer]MCZ4511793.1 hypothetical protein [Streptomyces sp. ActVer]
MTRRLRDACKFGHAWTQENTRITKQGWRACRTCHREANRRANGWKPRPDRSDFDHEFFAGDVAPTAWLAGLLAADGCVQGHRIWQLSLSGDVGAHLVKASASLIGHRRSIGVQRTGSQPSHRLHVSSAQHVTDLANVWKITPRKSLTLQWPTPPAHMARPFVRGYVDGDGHVSATEGGRFKVIGTPEFIEGMRSVLPITGGHVQQVGARTVAFALKARKARDLFAWMYADTDLPLSGKARTALEIIS